MTERIEGYFADQGSIHGSAGAQDEWLANLRTDARRALIRRLVMERIRTGGYGSAPRPVAGAEMSDMALTPLTSPDAAGADRWRLDVPRVLEALAIGVLVTVTSTWLCIRWGLNASKGGAK